MAAQCNAQAFAECFEASEGSLDLSYSVQGLVGKSVTIRPQYDDGSVPIEFQMPAVACGTIKPIHINPEHDMLPEGATEDGTMLGGPSGAPCVPAL